MDKTKDVENFGIRARGQAERIKCLKGKHLTRAEAMLAHCYDCTGGYADGARDCEMETCSIYGYMPYRENKEGAIRERTEKQKLNDRKLSSFRSTAHSFIKLQKKIA
jgi:hypothetical protein